MADGGVHGDSEVQRLAHDLIQSIAVIQAIVAATRLDPDDPRQVAENLAMVDREAGVMGELCRLHLAGPVAHTRVDLREVVGAAVDRMRPAYAGDLAVELVGTELTIVGDAAAWSRALLNLVENACRAAGPGGRVLVRGQAVGEDILVAVADSGPGFAESAPGRSSLGMVTVMRLVEGHGGHLEVRRGELGGAQLTMVVPRRDATGTT